MNDPLLPVISVAGYDRSRGQVVRLVDKTATTITIDPPLHYDLPATLKPRLYVDRAAAVFSSGMENLVLDMANSPSGYGASLGVSYGSWFKNVSVLHTKNYPLGIGMAVNCEVRESYISETQTGGTNHAGLLFSMATSCLIEDNIFLKVFPLLEMNGNASGNVFAYNLFGAETPGEWVDTNHSPHASHNLFEGNIMDSIISDGYFGGESDETIFRNWAKYYIPINLKRFSRNFNIVGNIVGLPGQLQTYQNFSNGKWVDGVGGSAYNLGLPNIGNPSSNGGYAQLSQGIPWPDNMTGVLTTRSSDTTGTVTFNGTGRFSPDHWPISMHWESGGEPYLCVGMNAGAVTPTTVGLVPGQNFSCYSATTALAAKFPSQGTAVRVYPGAGGFQEIDLDVPATTLRWGNYDYATNAIHFDPDEVPNDVPVPTTQTIPDSLFRTFKPAFFGNLAWPPFDPKSPLPGVTEQNHKTYYDLIPAGYRYNHGTRPQGASGGDSGTVVNGMCGVSVNTCSAGTFSDVTDTSTNYLWSCGGVNGGAIASCSLSSLDLLAPSILSVTASNLTTTGATISWSTDEAAGSYIEYGLTTSYGSRTATATSTQHLYTLSNLTPNTLYYYRVLAEDAAGNQSNTISGQFSTAAVVSSTDNDGDNVPNNIDKCPNTPAGRVVNTQGCPLPKADKYILTPLTSVDLNIVPLFEISTTSGKVSYPSFNAKLISSGDDRLDIDANLTIANKSISLNSTNLPELNRPATLTFYNLTFTNPRVLKDGLICTTCGTPVYSNGTLTFTVQGFSTYTVEETVDTTPSTHTLTIIPQGTGSGTVAASGIDCGSDCTETMSGGTSVTLTATPSSNSTFTSFSGVACTPVANKSPCTFTPSDDSTVIATFTLIPPPNQIPPPPPSGGGGGSSSGRTLVNIPPPDVLIPKAPNTGGAIPVPLAPLTKALLLNSRDLQVVTLQAILVQEKLLLTYTKGTLDLTTMNALKAFQVKYGIAGVGIPGYGVLGPKTRAKINSLIPKPTVTTSTFTRTLSLGSKGEDVQRLQQYLNAKGFKVATTGTGSPGKESTYFGPATKAALVRYQVANNITPTSGVFGPITRGRVNSLK